jgi:histone H3/H4
MQLENIITDASIHHFLFSVGIGKKKKTFKLKQKYISIVKHLIKIAHKNSDKIKITHDDVVIAFKNVFNPLPESSATVPCVQKYNKNCVLVRKTPFKKIIKYILQNKSNTKISQYAFNVLHKVTELLFKQYLNKNTKHSKKKYQSVPKNKAKLSVDSSTQSDNISLSESGTQSDNVIPQKVSVDSGTQSDNIIPQKVSVDSGTQSEVTVSVDSGTMSDNVDLSDSSTQSEVNVSVNSGTQSDNVVLSESGTQSDDLVSVESGTQSDNVVLSESGTQSDNVVLSESGTQSDDLVSVDSGTQSDNVVLSESGTQSDNVVLSESGTQSDDLVSVESGTQSDNVVLSESGTQSDDLVSVDSGTQSDNVVLSDSGTQTDDVSVSESDSESDDDDDDSNEGILSNIIIDLQSKNVDLQKAVEAERVQKELYKEMYEILESEQDTQSNLDKSEIETQTDLTHDDISDNEHEAVWQKVKRLNDKNKWKNKLLDKDLEVQSNKLQNNIERIKLQQDADLEILSEKLRYLSNRDKFVNDNLDYFNNMQNEINRLQSELKNKTNVAVSPKALGSTPLPDTEGDQGRSVMDVAVNTPLPDDTEGDSEDKSGIEGPSVMDIAVNTPLPDTPTTDFDTNVQEERWIWPSETETTPIETQGRSVMDIAVNTPLPDTPTTDFDTNVQEERWTWPSETEITPIETYGRSDMDAALPEDEEKWTWPSETETTPINSEITNDSEMETVASRKRNLPENASKSTSTLKRERLDSENEAIKWENQLNDFLKSVAKQKAEEKVRNDKKRWEKMLKKSIDESILKSKIAKADKIAFDIERNMVYSQPAQRKMQFNTINIHDKPRNEIKRAPLPNNKIPLNNTIAGKVQKQKRKISLPKRFDKDQLSQTKYGQAVLRNVQNRS